MVRVRLWTRQEIEVEVPEGATVEELEERVKEALGMDRMSVVMVGKAKGKALKRERSLQDYGIGADDLVVLGVDNLVVVFWRGEAEFRVRMGLRWTVGDAKQHFMKEYGAERVGLWWGDRDLSDDTVIANGLFSERRCVFRASELHVKMKGVKAIRKVYGLGSKAFAVQCGQGETIQDAIQEIARKHGLSEKMVSIDTDDELYEDLGTQILTIPKSCRLNLLIRFRVMYLNQVRGAWFYGDDKVSDVIDRISKKVDSKEWRCKGVTDSHEELMENDEYLFASAARGCYELHGVLEREIVISFGEEQRREWFTVTKSLGYVANKIAKSSGLTEGDLCVFIDGKLKESSLLLSEIESNVLELRYRTIVAVNVNNNITSVVRLADLKEKNIDTLKQYIAEKRQTNISRIQIMNEDEDMFDKPDGYEVLYKVTDTLYHFRFETGETFALPPKMIITQEGLVNELGRRVNLPPRELVLKFAFPLTPGKVYEFVGAKRQIELSLVLADGNKKRFRFDEHSPTVAQAKRFLHEKLGTTDDDCTYVFSCDGKSLAENEVITKNEVKVNQQHVVHVFNFVGNMKRFQACFQANATIGQAKNTIGRQIGLPPDKLYVYHDQRLCIDSEPFENVFTRSSPVIVDACFPVAIDVDRKRNIIWFPLECTGLDVKREVNAISYYPVDEIVLRDNAGNIIHSTDRITYDRVPVITASHEKPTKPVTIRSLVDKKEVTLNVLSNATIATILREACTQLALPYNDSSLIFAGKFLDPKAIVSTLYLTGGSVLLLYADK